MANKAGKLYIRKKVGYRKPPKRLADLPENETFVLFRYEGKARKAKAVGRFADKAQPEPANPKIQTRKPVGSSRATTRKYLSACREKLSRTAL